MGKESINLENEGFQATFSNDDDYNPFGPDGPAIFDNEPPEDIISADNALMWYAHDDYCNDFRPSLNKVLGKPLTDNEYARELNQTIRSWGLIKSDPNYFISAIKLIKKIEHFEDNEIIRSTVVDAATLLLDKNLLPPTDTMQEEERLMRSSQLSEQLDLLEIVVKDAFIWRRDQKYSEMVGPIIFNAITRFIERFDELYNFKNSIENGNFSPDIVRFFNLLFSHHTQGTEYNAHRDWAVNLLSEVRPNSEGYLEFVHPELIALLDQDYFGSYVKKKVEAILKNFCSKHAGIHPGKFWDYYQSWRLGKGDRTHFDTIAETIETATYLEKKSPGSVEFLTINFGIFNFGRYPKEALLRQAEDCKTNNVPRYGLLAFPRNDWNGAFYKKEVLEDLFEQMNSGQFTSDMIILEAGDKLSVLRNINSIRSKFGSADYAIFAGHGTGNTIAFGDTFDRNGKFNTGDVLKMSAIGAKYAQFNPDTANKQPFVKPGGTFIMFSCSTGVEGGIAQEISNLTKCKVVAPDVPTSARKIHYFLGSADQLPTLDVEYYDHDSKNVFQSGSLVK